MVVHKIEIWKNTFANFAFLESNKQVIINYSIIKLSHFNDGTESNLMVWREQLSLKLYTYFLENAIWTKKNEFIMW